MTHLRLKKLGRLTGMALAMAALVVLPACRGDRSKNPPRQFLPDMDDSPKWTPQSQSEFFTDGRTMRQPVDGTVPFGRFDFDANQTWAQSLPAAFSDHRTDLLKDNSRLYLGRDEAGEVIDRIPVAVTSDLLSRGQKRFNIYCSACHGYYGDGQGTVGVRWMNPPANFHDDKYKDRSTQTGKDGHLFDVVRNGFNTMPGYAHAVDEADAWAIVGYVRALQAARISGPSVGAQPAEGGDG